MDDRPSPPAAGPSAQPVALYEERGVADVLNAAFAFLRAFAVPLVKGLVYFAGPLLVTGQILATYSAAGASPNPAATAGLALLGSVANVVGSMVATTVVLAGVRLYHDDGSEGVALAALWEQTKAWVSAVLGTGLVLGIGLGVASFAVFFAVAGAVGVAGAGGANLLVVGAPLGMVAFAAVVYLVTKTAVTLPARVFDSRGAVPAIRRSFSLVTGHFGSTLAVAFLASLTALLLSLLFNIPAILVRFGTAFGFGLGNSAVASILTGIVAGVGSVVFSAVPTLASAFQYFTLVEAREHAGLAARVDALEDEVSLDEAPGEAPPDEAPDAVTGDGAGGGAEASRSGPPRAR
jgi:uncharacterized membrane protein